jgi:hydroxyacylglutathione hydrolase
MLLIRCYDTQLAQASYLIGCSATREAIVVDPNRDIDAYVAAADAERLTITHVIETHIHADFVSGARALAERTGARLLVSGAGGPDWQYRFDAERVGEGDRFTVGQIVFDVMHTPGHTPEHVSFLVTDGAASTVPMGMLTGDFVFVGDVGRPDLLERAAGETGTMDAAARTLFRSLRRFKTLPDHLQIWPGHGAGSACGKSLSAVPSSTVGYERVANWALGIDDEDRFVREVLDGQPEPPAYFGRMKRINRDGPPPLRATPHPPAQFDVGLGVASGATVIDLRPIAEFAAGHVAGTINIPFESGFATWAGSIVPDDRPIYLVGAPAITAAAARALALIGIDDLRGSFDVHAGQAVERTAQVTATALVARRTTEAMTIVDVRARHEWDAGHIPGAVHLPLGEVARRSGELPRDRTIVVHCQGGTRSAIAASLLQALGLARVENLVGGFAEWQRAGATTSAA